MFEREIPLVFNWDHRPFWPRLQQEFGCCEAGAATLTALHATKGSGKATSYSRNKNAYGRISMRYHNKLYTYAKIPRAADHLASQGLIEHHKKPSGSLGWQSWMRLTPECSSYLDALMGDELMALMPIEPVILRDRDKKLVNYSDCPETRIMRRKICLFNEAIAGSNLKGCIPGSLTRIFNQTFDRGGRFYVSGGSWQCKSKLARAQILIDGEPVVEIDYTSLHATLVYGNAGIRKPENCYEIDNWPRELVKLAFLILLNAQTESSAIRAIANTAEMAARHSDFSDALLSSKRLVAAIKQRHQAISRFFHSDAGAKLMRIDSDMAEIVMTKLNSQGIAALPIHDSFLVQAKHAENLREAMLQAAQFKGYQFIGVI